MTNKWEINNHTNDQNSHINDQMTVLVANFRSLITKHMTRLITILMTKHMTRLMTILITRLMTKHIQTYDQINDQIYEQINDHPTRYK